MLPRKRSHLVVWGSVLAVAIITRTIALGRWPGLNGDESWYGVNVQEWLAGGTPFLTTGVGNPLSPLHSGLLLILSTVLEPSGALLRLPEVILGIIAVALAYPLLRAPLGERAALLTTVFIALSPTAVAYSRLGWDPSGTPLLILLAIGAALHDRWLLALIAIGFGYLVHPTNVFAVPIVLCAWLPYAVDRYRTTTALERRRLLQAGVAASVVAIPVVAWMLVRIANNPATPLPSISMALERLVSPGLWIHQLQGALNLLSGVSSLVYIVGALKPGAATLTTSIVGLIAVGTLVLTWSLWRRHRHTAWLVIGILVAFAGFHVVAIPNAFDPGFERYALFLLMPMLMVSAIAVDAAMDRLPAASAAIAVAIPAVMATLLGVGYFIPLANSGGASERTYRTGAVEPKLAAFRFIDADSRDAKSVTIIANDWWLYWTLRYFAGVNGRIHVEPDASVDIPGGTHPASAGKRPAPQADRIYRVRFATPASPMIRAKAAYIANDPAGSPVVEVLLLAQQNRPQ